VELLKRGAEPGVPQRKDLPEVWERLAEEPLVARRQVSPLLLLFPKPQVAEPQVLVPQGEVQQQALALQFPLLMKPASVPRVWQPVAWVLQVWLLRNCFPGMCRQPRLASKRQVAARWALAERNRPELADEALGLAWALMDRLEEQFRLRLQPEPTVLVSSKVLHQLRLQEPLI